MAKQQVISEPLEVSSVLYASNLPEKTDMQWLKTEFNEYGKIKDALIGRSGEFCCTALIFFDSIESAVNVYNKKNNVTVEGRPLHLEYRKNRLVLSHVKTYQGPQSGYTVKAESIAEVIKPPRLPKGRRVLSKKSKDTTNSSKSVPSSSNSVPSSSNSVSSSPNSVPSSPNSVSSSPRSSESNSSSISSQKWRSYRVSNLQNPVPNWRNENSSNSSKNFNGPSESKQNSSKWGSNPARSDSNWRNRTEPSKVNVPQTWRKPDPEPEAESTQWDCYKPMSYWLSKMAAEQQRKEQQRSNNSQESNAPRNNNNAKPQETWRVRQQRNVCLGQTTTSSSDSTRNFVSQKSKELHTPRIAGYSSNNPHESQQQFTQRLTSLPSSFSSYKGPAKSDRTRAYNGSKSPEFATRSNLVDAIKSPEMPNLSAAVQHHYKPSTCSGPINQMNGQAMHRMVLTY